MILLGRNFFHSYSEAHIKLGARFDRRLRNALGNIVLIVINDRIYGPVFHSPRIDGPQKSNRFSVSIMSNFFQPDQGVVPFKNHGHTIMNLGGEGVGLGG